MVDQLSLFSQRMSEDSGSAISSPAFLDGSAPCSLPVADSTPIVCGLRPEFIVPTSATDRGFAVRVQLVENTGSEVHVTGQVGDTRVRAVLSRKAAQPRLGELLRFDIRGGEPLYFDTATGLRLRLGD